MKPNFRKTIRISKLQSRHHMVGQAFNPGGDRTNSAWLGSYWFDVSNFDNEGDMTAQRNAYIEQLTGKYPELSQPNRACTGLLIPIK